MREYFIQKKKRASERERECQTDIKNVRSLLQRQN